MEFGRNAKNEKEKELVKRCYEAGMKNDWANGKFDRQDGNFIVEEDRLNPNSIFFIDNKQELKKFFKHGNWCLGTGVIYKDLFFLEQINGGNEWATHKITDKEIKQFESISFKRIVDDNDPNFDEYLKRLEGSVEEYWKGGNKMNVKADFGETKLTVGFITTLEELKHAFKTIEKRALEKGAVKK